MNKNLIQRLEQLVDESQNKLTRLNAIGLAILDTASHIRQQKEAIEAVLATGEFTHSEKQIEQNDEGVE